MFCFARALATTLGVVALSMAATPAFADMGPIGTSKKIGAGVGGGSLAYGSAPRCI